MNLVFADWLIVIVMMSLMVWGVLYSRKLMQSVSDFLSANRSAGRYIVSFSQGMAQLGAITIVGMLEMNYIAGFTLRWWEYANGIVLLIIAVSGWVIYRFRETRALTMAQFLEMRYSRNFRIFSGSLAFISGIINFGLFPAVGARFFMYFIGLPQTYNFLGIQVSTLATLMIMLLAVSLFFVFVGGQISVMIADFIQGWFVNVTFVVISIYLVTVIDWNIVTDALLSAPENASLINPFNASGIQDYNFWYFLIGMIGLVYGKLTWQGTQGYYVSARNPHEAKMGEVLGNWRLIPQWSLFLIFVPVIAYTVMHHPSYSAIVESIQPTLDTIDNEALRTQITVPMVLTKLLPVGLIGSFIAIMIAAFVSTHDTYLHSWASIFIQDIVLPLRTKHLPQKLHLRMLKAAILGVAIFIFFFSLIFQQSEYIFLFFAITGSIFAGGAGSVIIGGLYWKKGTTAAAWTAMITGLVISVGGIILQQVFPGFPINGQMFWGIAMFSSAGSYVLVSLLSRKPDFNLDKLLHRGKYSIEDDSAVVTKAHSKIWKYFGVGKEFTKGDKVIYIATYVWTFLWSAVFIFGTVYNLTHDVSNTSWMYFWEIYIYINIGISIVVIIWFSIGGWRDFRDMFKRLRTIVRNPDDDGFVESKKVDPLEIITRETNEK